VTRSSAYWRVEDEYDAVIERRQLQLPLSIGHHSHCIALHCMARLSEQLQLGIHAHDCPIVANAHTFLG